MTTAFPALGTTAELLLTDPTRLGEATAVLREELAAIDSACSRFREDSEISRLNAAAGRQVRVGSLLAEALAVALRAARLTEGLVDPTVGAAVRELGYDRDFALLAGDRDTAAAPPAESDPGPAAFRGEAAARPHHATAPPAEGESGRTALDSAGVPVTGAAGERPGPAAFCGEAAARPHHATAPPAKSNPGRTVPDPAGVPVTGAAGDRGDPAGAAIREAAPGWHRVLFDPVQRLVVLPRGVHLDLGATAKALAADRGARRIHAAFGCGVLVNLGGDLRAAGPPPSGGWLVALGDDHAEAVAHPATTVALHRDGALATSGTTRRRWRHGGRVVHHIVDPRTGDVPEPRWRTVTVAAKSTVDANTASTAAVVLGAAAPGWLERRHLPARLVGVDGDVVTTPGWPGERKAA
ncbi:FAD:protein FMN transferase [Amycolatopsis sp. lyj-23]|uniref:FAD:protein FMN transferase n=1 Tax=Amycolatopsis sp. lyj-23 TaxID=2789283 RepID=UPI00397CBD92